VLVTGGHGFIGRHVVRLVARRGGEPVVPYLEEHPHQLSLPGTHVHADLRNIDAAVLEGVEAVIHLAARSGGIQFQEEEAVLAENHAITGGVLTAAAAADVSRVFLSSSTVIYADAGPPPLAESAAKLGPEDAPSAYALSKLADEEAGAGRHAAGAFDVVVGRFANVYGPEASFDPGRSTVIHSLIAKAVEAANGGAFTVWGDGKAVRSFIFVEDVARAVVAIVERGAGGEAYNVDTSVPITIVQLAQLIGRLVGLDVRPEFDTTKPVGSAYRVTDSTKLAALGFEPRVGLEEGLSRTISAYRSRYQPS
jgi:GDP-L-fucose synthase